MTSYDDMRLSVVIPCFNEAARLRRTLGDVLEWTRANHVSAEIIAVDDGSTDETVSLIEQWMRDTPELSLVRLPHNRGKGAAVRAGMRAATGERRAFIDADGAVPFREMERFGRALDEGADIVIGSRVLDPSRVEALAHRRYIGAAFRGMVRWLLVRGVEDTQCGFKLFRAAAADLVFTEQRLTGFAFDVEVLARAERLGLRIVELPVEWHEQKGSKVRLVRDGLAMAADLVRLRRRLGSAGTRRGSQQR